MYKVLHANDDNSTLSGAFIIAWRVDKYLRELGIAYDYISMDKFNMKSDAEFAIPIDSKTFGANLRSNRLIGLIKLPFYVYSVIKKHKYSIVHIDCDYTYKALLYALPAKILGAKTVVHSHTTGLAGDYQFIKLLAHKLSNKVLNVFTDEYIGCSKEAAKWLIPPKRISEKSVLFNGIDLEKFYYDEEVRNSWRKKLGLQDKFIIGNMGSLCERKNQSFLIDVLLEVKKSKENAVLLLVGPGVEKYIDKMKDKTKQYGLEESVFFYGMTTNTWELLNAMDVFAFPSYVEGAPLALYEAEATGLTCVMSDTISNDAIICDWVDVQPIDKGANIWAQAINKIAREKIIRKDRKVDEKYGLAYMAKSLERIYTDILEVKN